MEYTIIALTALNSILLIGIAGSLTKLINYIQSEQDSKQEWAEIIKSRKNAHSRLPNYTDSLVPQNWDGIPKNSRNWDGVIGEKE